MIKFMSGDLLRANVEALVNTVNTVGVMGKGIALQFKQAFPANFSAYEKAAKREEIIPGKMHVFETGQFTNPRYIINFPTKRHWRGKARIEDIQTGLQDLIRVIHEKQIRSIAIPPLGCGFGGLDWNEVRPIILAALEQVPDVDVWLYAPEGAPEAEKMAVGTNRPGLTVGRAALIELIEKYALPGYRLTQIEIQKLAYFLQAAGEPLRLDYARNQFGPYAEKLHFVIQRLNGHYLSGYGDRSNASNIYLLPNAKEEAEQFLKDHPDTQEHLEKVSNLIDGFETPYGMELLATVHWLAQEDPSVKNDYKAAVHGFETWNQRKREHFKPEHIKTAWERLKQQGWI
ncbi:MAG TPA: macro domain-containing protein [Anaerolineales bacterium]|nr:Appr-1-p processing protein [Chloroflexota bacterium]WKZ55524.1 MAG: macro domain-containing protein [Anaerolineales bacterium]GJQ37300.1 MAG: Appr-1-p processing protein [Anaerolineaceae bacterium]NOG74309.1 macro domain-containing protein [Chloroflexota bacterium]GIK09060.1 MAG: Appr-1-p processing protein [Chloroflexota bacterium]